KQPKKGEGFSPFLLMSLEVLHNTKEQSEQGTQTFSMKFDNFHIDDVKRLLSVYKAICLQYKGVAFIGQETSEDILTNAENRLVQAMEVSMHKIVEKTHAIFRQRS
ncbi:MAG: hypothetical protein AABY22_33765, partial [Nanoarchaeota archaeon]